MFNKQRRFDYYRPHGDLTDTEAAGLLPCDSDYDFGTPNLERDENLTYVASNSTLGECLLLQLKWRPDMNRKTVSTITRLTFIAQSRVYQFSQAETFKPIESFMRPGRITQYGSQASKMKIFIMSPYRRSRIFFQGHLKEVLGDDQELETASDVVQEFKTTSAPKDHELKTIFLRLSCVMQPISEIFDFHDQYDPKCLKELCTDVKAEGKNPKIILKKLILHDRHEQRLKFAGEYTLINGQEKERKIFSLRGYNCRHFPDRSVVEQAADKTTRLYATMNNGQGFHIGRRQLAQDEINFGYTSFHIYPKARFIERPYKMLDVNKLETGLPKFQVQVSGQQCTFTATGERKFQDWYQMNMNGKPGWGWISRDDGLIEDYIESRAIERIRSELEQDEKLGKVCKLESKCDSEAVERPLVVSIEEECCTSSQLVGSKAAYLAQLAKFVEQNRDSGVSYQVPFAFVITRFAHDLILKDNPKLGEAVEALRVSVGKHQLASLEGECKKMEELVAGCECPKLIIDNLWQSISSHYANENLSELLFAVRSSSWGEDEADMSAAGQLTTLLNVKANQSDLGHAIMKCFASKFSHENVQYKRQHGQPLDLPMAVVVQRMIACEKAGVMFTCDPTTGDESLLTITANYGLGESVVSAQADPDSIMVRVAIELADVAFDAPRVSPAERRLTIEGVTIGKKNVVMSKDDPNGIRNYDRHKCCLDENEILQLARCGLEIKRYFWSQKCDIEWGFLQGRLHLFQSRPVTGLEIFTKEELMHECDKPSPAEVNYVSRANIGEVMPYAVKPLTLTHSVHSWNLVGFRLYVKYLPNEMFYAPQVSLDVTNEFYHTFFNCRGTSFLALSEKEKSVLARSMEIGLFGREMGEQPEIAEAARGFIQPPNPFTGTRFNLLTLSLKLMPSRKVEREKPLMDRLRQDVRQLKYATGYENNKLLGLYNQFSSMIRFVENCWSNHILIIIFGTNANVVLSSLLSKYIKDPKQLSAATNKFLAISPDVVSAEIPEKISHIAQLIHAKGSGEAQKFASLPVEEALDILERDDHLASKPAREAFADFIKTFGHRCYNEFELADYAWREEPKRVVQMIQKNCAAICSMKPEDAEQQKQQQSKRPKTIDQVIESLQIDLSFKDRFMIKYFLAPKCQLMLSLREKTKNILVLHTDIIRECSRMLATELQLCMRIPDRELLYYLTYDELKPIVLDHQPTIVLQASRRRKLFKEMFSEVWKFDEIFSEIIPNHMKATKELDQAVSQAPRLLGTPASSGKIKGKVCLVQSYNELDKVRPGSILVTHSTDIAFSPVFPLISGIITEVGGLISHGAVVAREYGLPSVIGIPDITRVLQDGEEILLDADNGAIIRLSPKQSAGNGVVT